jgi:uncharacterized membrane protein (DUF4010 family)
MLCGQLGEAYGGWVVAAGFVGLVACVVWANVAKTQAGSAEPGMTSEITALLLFALGAYLVVGSLAVAVVVGGVVVLLLQFKQPMHAFAAAIGDDDIRAIMQFVLLTLVILPVLPREDMGPYGAWNPFEIWLVVALIVGLSLSGYVAYKFFGARAGPLLAGALGGMISSTAVTASYARRAAGESGQRAVAALVIAVATCISLVRVLAEVAAVAPGSLMAMAPPIALLLLAALVATAGLYAAHGDELEAMPAQRNPASLGSALAFGALYSLVLLAVAAGRDRFGEAGLFAVAALSGLTDLDAITISTAGLVETGRADPSTAWRAIVVAALSNLVFKFGTAAALGGAGLARRVGAAFALIAACGGALLWLWPS